jgi:hypothetical protein
MTFFPALGAAALGIFITIVLSGILAGIIAFGLIEARFRRKIQRRVIGQLVDEPVYAFLHKRSNIENIYDSEESSEYFPNESSAYFVLEKLTSTGKFKNNPSRMWRGDSLIAVLVRLKPNYLFALPYRQVCGQIANAIGSEAHDDDFDEPPSSYDEGWHRVRPLTLALLIADQEHSGFIESDLSYLKTPHPKVRALAYLDSVQIALANAIFDKVRTISLFVTSLIITGIVASRSGMLNLWVESASTFLQIAGGIAASIGALLINFLLVIASTVVAVLTFGWIDRYATAR